jgi:protein ImuB
VAIHLPWLLSEIVVGRPLRLSLNDDEKRPLYGIVLVDAPTDEVKPTDLIDSVCLRAHRAGVRAGQTINEARALVYHLQVQALERQEVEERLIAVAEVVQQYGMTVSWELPQTVWVDVTGVAHLFGGEEALLEELHEQVRLLGHTARVCLAAGPQISQALAQYGGKSCLVVPREETARMMGDLPLLALPLSPNKVSFLSRLGLFSVEQLRALPAKTASSRLGDRALEVLTLAQGVDRAPLVPGNFPCTLIEEVEWEDPAYGLEPLLFALRGLLAKLSARLRGRGEACSRIEILLRHDQAIARHRGVLSQTLIEFDLSSPLCAEGDLERVLKSRLSKVEMKAPTLGIKLSAEQLSPAAMNQMGLSETGLTGTLRGRGAAFRVGQQRHEELSVLLAELESDVGPEGLGTLGLNYAFRPEARSVLEPVASPTKTTSRRKSPAYSKGPHAQKKGQKKTNARSSSKGGSAQKRVAREAALYLSSPSFERITRLIKSPRPLGTSLHIGASFGMGTELYTIEHLRFIQRLDDVEWWTPEATSRDYFWAWLSSPGGGAEALLFVDRQSGDAFLQAWGD